MPRCERSGSDQVDCLALCLERHRHHCGVIVDQPDAADRGRWQDGAATAGRLALVVERDIARDDREVERATGRSHAFEGMDELAHDLGPLRIGEIEAVGHCQRTCADRAKIAIGLGDRLLAAFIGICMDIARSTIGGDRERFFGAMHPDHARISAGL